MIDDQVSHSLADLERTAQPARRAEDRARQNMFDALAGTEPERGRDGNDASMAEIFELVAPRELRGKARFRHASAALVAGALLVGGILTIDLVRRAGTTADVVDIGFADSSIDAAPNVSEPEPLDDASASVADRDLPRETSIGDATSPSESPEAFPRLVDGAFESARLGFSVSFRAERPMWLTDHGSDIISFTLDPDDPDAATFVIARASAATDEIAEHGLTAFLLSSPALTGQRSTVVSDGVVSTIWTGKVRASWARDSRCETTRTVCVTLFDQPQPLGLRAEMEHGLMFRSLPDGSDLVVIATFPPQHLNQKHFGVLFDDTFSTLTVDVVETTD